MAGNRRWKRLIGLLFVLLIWDASAVLAAVPAEINYQGSIEDLSGPVDGTLDLTFRLFDANVAGTIVWEEANSVLVNQGVYNVILGAGTLNSSYGSLEEAIFENDDLWLEVQVAGEADAMAPRQKLTSVGFALRAGSMSEGTITATMLADDAITTDKLVDGAVTAAKVAGGFVPDLDADKLDGLDAASFASSAHNHDSRYYSKSEMDTLVSGYENRIAALEAKLQYLTVVAGTVNGLPGPHVMITGANLHVRNGLGQTNSVNQTGNLIVGYNELRGTGNNRSGSHNIVVGQRHNYASYGGLVAGYNNAVSDIYSTVSGGSYNTAAGSLTSISGGSYNTAGGAVSSVSGGDSNTASGYTSSVSGGRYNKASGDYSFVGGGGGDSATWGNEVFSHYSAILGGRANIAGDKSDPNDHSKGQQSTISGGAGNATTQVCASVSGGAGNKSNGYMASISGGWENTTSGEFSSISGGGNNKAIGDFSFIGGGGWEYANSGNLAFARFSAILGGGSNGTGDVSIIFNEIGGYYEVVPGSDHYAGSHSTVSGGYGNKASGIQSSVSCGLRNEASNDNSSVSGGRLNKASGSFSSVSGGYLNEAIGNSSSVGGGTDNTASNYYSSVSGGYLNEAIGNSSFVGGGTGNTASNHYSSVSGGTDNTASGRYSSVTAGSINTASGEESSVTGGRGNHAEGLRAAVHGGYGNHAWSWYSAVLGGQGNYAGDPSDTTHEQGRNSTVSGGYDNDAYGNHASVLGGAYNPANGTYSTNLGDATLIYYNGDLVPW